MSEGCFIVLEGIDGSGTTTQAQQLAEWVAEVGRRTLLTREPTGGPVGRFLRSALEHRLADSEGRPEQLDWQTMALLFSADRMDHLEREILPALARGEVVLSDRYDLSSLLYQSCTAGDAGDVLPWLRSLNERARRPDLTVVLDVPAAVAEERRRIRGGLEELYEKRELQQRLAEGYRQAAKLLPEDRIVVLEASGTIEKVQADLRRLLEPLVL